MQQMVLRLLKVPMMLFIVTELQTTMFQESFLILGAISTQDLTVTGNVNASVDANITGNAAITGNIAVTGTANVTADANVAGNVNVTSTINGSTATFTGNVNADNFVSTNELVYTDGTVGNISVRNLITTTSTSAPSSGVGDDGDFYLIHDA